MCVCVGGWGWGVCVCAWGEGRGGEEGGARGGRRGGGGCREEGERERGRGRGRREGKGGVPVKCARPLAPPSPPPFASRPGCPASVPLFPSPCAPSPFPPPPPHTCTRLCTLSPHPAHTHTHATARGRGSTRGDISYLVDPASSHMLSSKAKPCMSKYKGIQARNCERLITTVVICTALSPS